MAVATHDSLSFTGLPKQDGNRWIPLESDPDIMNDWAQQLGLQTSVHSFQDVYGLDSELLALVPRPVKAILLLFPNVQAVEDARSADEAKRTAASSDPIDPDVIFIKQTISNACGTIALLHALANAPDVRITLGSPLEQFIKQCKDKTPQERAELLENTNLFAQMHKAAAEAGRSVITPDLETDLHFICFIQAKSQSDPDGMRLLELDGRRATPVDYGPCTDMLADVAKVAQDKYLNSTNSLQFSMTALAPTDF
ncbi:peptidase C12 ubiquitin carboxyl-terminal hydrolase 1 [Dacryopinax primogenitus]|uniref:Ubiquitin carboxyl-terminal hydrolase n=1 Tax=Dacryopinax primogenitus (strain DJM 731) TaxID=1858805 RepID=M5GF34_DACPD|nr:peptidase C12 ubiquitin carboxyl-terminal hydrolase 1 [Dacryopinax primogenitus]EJU03798.1 peptidase C12 ubiquitin carboxyl-terminal hydrolase 1 [Dacryopinax primogenitus]